MTPISISAKTLGALALPNFCPRCFWLRQRLANKLPWQIFPGVFSSIDSYSKRITTAHFELHGCAPAWLRPFGDIVELIEPPHWSKFSIFDSASGVTLRGVPDVLCRCANRTLAIIDNKTARYSEGQDALAPLYQVQLNAYAMIAEQLGFGSVAALGLVYFEPPGRTDRITRTLAHDGFKMSFRAKPVEVLTNLEMVPPLLAMARGLHDLATPPRGRAGCQDCEQVAALMEVISLRPNPNGALNFASGSQPLPLLADPASSGVSMISWNSLAISGK